MAEKNALAQFLDNLVEGKRVQRGSDGNADVVNMLPKPDSQEIGNGFIMWRWAPEGAVIESFLVTRHVNDLGLDKDSYVVNLRLPESEEFSWAMFDDVAKGIGSSLLSAWNWKNIWKLHAGDFLLEVMSQEPVEKFDISEGTRDPKHPISEPEIIEPEIIKPKVVKPRIIDPSDDNDDDD